MRSIKRLSVTTSWFAVMTFVLSNCFIQSWYRECNTSCGTSTLFYSSIILLIIPYLRVVLVKSNDISLTMLITSLNGLFSLVHNTFTVQIYWIVYRLLLYTAIRIAVPPCHILSPRCGSRLMIFINSYINYCLTEIELSRSSSARVTVIIRAKHPRYYSGIVTSTTFFYYYTWFYTIPFNGEMSLATP